MPDRLLPEFLAEAEELTEELYRDLSDLRRRRAEGRARRELVGRVFRHVHTLKGGAAAAGVEPASALAHDFESLLDAVRGGRAALSDEVLDAFDEALDALADALGAVSRGESAVAPRGLGERLRALAAVGARPPGGAYAEADALLPPEVAGVLSEAERQRVREAAAEGARVFVVEARFGLEDFDEQFRRLSASLAEGGEVVSAQPFVDGGAPELVGFRVVCATEEAREELERRVAPFGATLVEGVAGEGGAPEAPDAPPPTASPLTMHVRVTLEELDELIFAAHELFAETAGALDLALSREAGREELEARAPRLRRSLLELEERLIGLRMVSVGATLERAARVGRSVARAAGKQIDFELGGGDVRLDKSLAERVADPLLHLLRNAVDHGVEQAGERLAAGKPPRGRVRVEAEASGGRVSLRVSDDGRGVDLERVERAARERGLLAPGARVTEQQALRLIFRPGFSTAERATEVSGRGVGLDIVERMIEREGGDLRVRSERGRGTSFELRLPTTVALVPALFVRAGGQVYCLDARHAEEADQAAPELPVYELRELLGRPARGAHEEARASLVVVRARREDEGDGDAETSFVLVVDGVEGRGEVLVRGLGRHGPRWSGVSGATELRDGTVALVLDLPRLL